MITQHKLLNNPTPNKLYFPFSQPTHVMYNHSKPFEPIVFQPCKMHQCVWPNNYEMWKNEKLWWSIRQWLLYIWHIEFTINERKEFHLGGGVCF
jgi:hypothetical protein